MNKKATDNSTKTVQMNVSPAKTGRLLAAVEELARQQQLIILEHKKAQ